MQPDSLSPNSSTFATDSSVAATVGRFRWRICALIFFANTINYIDRQVLGLLAPELEKSFGWSEVEYGYIVTAFQAAFALGYLVFGWLIDRYGTKMGYALAITIWSLAAIGHGLARTILHFGIARAFLGLGEGGNTPAAIKGFTEYFPRRERALATGLFNGGSSLGAVLAPVIVPLMAVRWGWESAFIITGALGFIWILFWLRLYEAPEKQPRLSRAELTYILSDQDESTAEKVSWATLLNYKATWAFVMAKFLTDPIFWFYLYWLPKFLNKQYNLNITNSVLPLLTIYTIVAIGSATGGWFSSYFLKKGWSLNRSRKSVMLVSALCIMPIVLAATTADMWVAVLLIGLAAAAHQSWSAVLFTTVSDMFPKKAVATVIGIGGTAGAIGGMLIATATGYLLEATGSYLAIFMLAGTIYILTLGLYHWIIPTIRKIDL